MIIVPLAARGRTLGAMTLVTAESGRRYAEADLGSARSSPAMRPSPSITRTSTAASTRRR